MSIFDNIYNKVVGFFRQAEVEDSAKDVARSRLKVVLMQDRTNINPALLERMRKDLVKLLTKYLELDDDALELNLEQDGDQMALMLSIPVIRAKDEDEIEEDDETEEESEDEDADEEIGEREEAEIEEIASDEEDEIDKEAEAIIKEVEAEKPAPKSVKKSSK